MHNDITSENQNLLKSTIGQFSYATLDFINAKNALKEVWASNRSKNHFALEMFYKLLLESYFSQYDKVIVSDVDVVFLGDVSRSFLDFDANSHYYIAGVRANNPNEIYPLKGWKEGYKAFSKKEFEAIQYGVGGGYLIANIKLWKKDNIQKKLVDYAYKNAHRLILAEQDTLNLILYPHIATLTPAHIVGHKMWELYGENWEGYIPNIYTQEQIDDARNNPIQLHFIGHLKPWNTPNVAKSEVWINYLVKTPYLKKWLGTLTDVIVSEYLKTTWRYKIMKYIKENPAFVLDFRFYCKLTRKIYKGLWSRIHPK